MITTHKEYLEIKLQDTNNNNWYLYSSSSATQRFPTHRSTYATAQHKFREFCQQVDNLHLSGSPCLANDWTLCLFATFLAQSVHHSTIKVYLSGVRALHVEQTPLRTLCVCNG